MLSTYLNILTTRRHEHFNILMKILFVSSNSSKPNYYKKSQGGGVSHNSGCLRWHFRNIDIFITCFTVCSRTCFDHPAVQGVSINRKHFAKYHLKCICHHIKIPFEILALPVTVTSQSFFAASLTGSVMIGIFILYPRTVS